MTTSVTSYRLNADRIRQLAELGRRIESKSRSKIIDFALGYTLAHIKGENEMDIIKGFYITGTRGSYLEAVLANGKRLVRDTVSYGEDHEIDPDIAAQCTEDKPIFSDWALEEFEQYVN